MLKLLLAIGISCATTMGSAVVAAELSTVSGSYLTNLKLLSTAVAHQNYSGTHIPDASPKTLFAPVNVSCPSQPAGNCTIVATVTAEVFGNLGDEIHLCFALDGKYMPPGAPGCTRMGDVTHLEFGNLVSTGMKRGVLPGSHSLRPWISAGNGVDVYGVTAEIRVYK